MVLKQKPSTLVVGWVFQMLTYTTGGGRKIMNNRLTCQLIAEVTDWNNCRITGKSRYIISPFKEPQSTKKTPYEFFTPYTQGCGRWALVAWPWVPGVDPTPTSKPPSIVHSEDHRPHRFFSSLSHFPLLKAFQDLIIWPVHEMIGIFSGLGTLPRPRRLFLTTVARNILSQLNRLTTELSSWQFD